MFRTADIHEVLPPILATLLVRVMAAVDVISNANAEVPAVARIVFLLGAPVSVTCCRAGSCTGCGSTTT
ncbi:hypothetical protein [Streptomyces sp. NPDC005507]|uniref:hypothetical protein n=1 Tax=Streptomyces sp. NPDC005507 TaxID=3154885 RepID=UPI0033A03DB9